MLAGLKVLEVNLFVLASMMNEVDKQFCPHPIFQHSCLRFLFFYMDDNAVKLNANWQPS
jgi:hypothetical protein